MTQTSANQLPEVSHLSAADLLELRAATTDQRTWYAASRELAARAEGADWRAPIAEAASDPEPDRITDPGAWFSWRYRQTKRAALAI